MDKIEVVVSGFDRKDGFFIIKDFEKLGPSELIEIERQVQNLLRNVHVSMYKAGM